MIKLSEAILQMIAAPDPDKVQYQDIELLSKLAARLETGIRYKHSSQELNDTLDSIEFMLQEWLTR